MRLGVNDDGWSAYAYASDGAAAYSSGCPTAAMRLDPNHFCHNVILGVSCFWAYALVAKRGLELLGVDGLSLGVGSNNLSAIGHPFVRGGLLTSAPSRCRCSAT